METMRYQKLDNVHQKLMRDFEELKREKNDLLEACVHKDKEIARLRKDNIELLAHNEKLTCQISDAMWQREFDRETIASLSPYDGWR